MAVRDQVITKDYSIYNGDCIEVMQSLPNESIHLSIYSPPFAGLYHYSSDIKDLSNCLNNDEFMQHYSYVVEQIHRLTPSGRITAVHVTDVIKSVSGHDTLVDLSGMTIKIHQEMGFDFIARHTIWKEPLWVRNRTYVKALFHSQICEDAAYAGVASADYLLVFRKRGTNKVPIEHPTGFEYYAGECPIDAEYLQYKNWKGDQKQNKWSHHIWRRYASSIWDDIRIGRVLQFNDSKEKDDEKHVHPLQLDVIDRCISLRSNQNEIVLTPFMGVGSEVYSAITNGRKGIGIELKPSYFKQAVKNLELAGKDNTYKDAKQLSLFDDQESKIESEN